MLRSFKDFVGLNIEANGFRLGTRDAYDAAKNIGIIFVERTSWFKRPKPIPIDELRSAYKILCPGMERQFPGVVDQMFQTEIISQLGYQVDSAGMVHFRP